MAEDAFTELMQRWSAGDGVALGELLAAELPWIRRHVHARLGPLLRRRGDTHDYVHDALLDVLRDGPRFVVRDRRGFRALIARIVENTLRDAHEHFTARRRDVRREQPELGQTTLQLDPSVRSATRPSEAASREETRAWLRLGLELLEPEDRRVILLRGYEERPFEEVAAVLGISTKAAQMRFARALARLPQKIDRLMHGRLDELLG